MKIKIDPKLKMALVRLLNYILYGSGPVVLTVFLADPKTFLHNPKLLLVPAATAILGALLKWLKENARELGIESNPPRAP